MSDTTPLESLLASRGLRTCPECKTPMTAENVGWNPSADFADVLPIVYIACKRCQKRLVTIPVTEFARDRDDAIQKANEAG